MNSTPKNRLPIMHLVLISLLSLVQVRASGAENQPATATVAAANYSPEEFDRTMVRIPAGPFLFGMTEQEKQAVAREAGVHPEMLRHHSNRQLLTTKEFWIDEYPVTRGQFLRFLKATGYQIPYNGWLVAWRELLEKPGFKWDLAAKTPPPAAPQVKSVLLSEPKSTGDQFAIAKVWPTKICFRPGEWGSGYVTLVNGTAQSKTGKLSVSIRSGLKAEQPLIVTNVALNAGETKSVPVVWKIVETEEFGRKLRATMQLASRGKKRMTLLVACPVAVGEKLSLEDAARAARTVSDQGAAKGLHALRKEHDHFWHDYWAKSGVLMHSADGMAAYVENLYHLQLYWMACLSRGPEAPKFNGGNFLFCNDWRNQFYQYYLHTRDETFLREKAYPPMKEVLTYHLSFLHRETFLKRKHNEWTYGNAWDGSALMAARLGLSNEVVKCFGQYARSVQEFPCGLPGTPGNAPKTWGGQIGDSPGLDAAGVLAAAVQEMQLQSYGGVIRVFPAWPKGWQSEFTLAAEGGFLVSRRVNTNGDIPEVRIRSQLGGDCTVVNPWPGDAKLRSQQGTRTLSQTNRFIIATKPGDEFILTPTAAAAKFEPIPVTHNAGPKWPFHQGANDTIENYLKRTDSFGMLGIAKDGQNLTRNKVRKALAEQAQAKEKK